MAVQSIEYAPTLSADTGAHPSSSIWKRFPKAAILEDPSYGRYIREDFLNVTSTPLPVAGTTTSSTALLLSGDAGTWRTYQDTSCTLLPLTALVNGVLRSSLTATGSKACVMELGNANATATEVGPFLFTDGSGPKIFFETRIRVNAITDSIQNFFIGLSQSGVAVVPASATSATTLFDSGTTVGQCDKIGFCIQTGASNGAIISACYGKVSTAQTILGTVQTAVAATWYKLGFILDPISYYTVSPGGAFIKGRFFVNGQEIPACAIVDTSAGTTGGNPNALNSLGNPNYASGTAAALVLNTSGPTVAATAFPTAKQMTLAMHHETVTSTAATIDVDFIHAGQVYNS